MRNTVEDTKRILLEQEKLNLEIEMLKKQNRNLDLEFELVTLKKLHCSLKVTNEFGVNLE